MVTSHKAKAKKIMLVVGALVQKKKLRKRCSSAFDLKCSPTVSNSIRPCGVVVRSATAWERRDAVAAAARFGMVVNYYWPNLP